MADKEQKLIDKFLDATSNLILYWKNVHGYPYSEIKSILDESVRDHVAWVKKILKDEP